MKLLKSLFILSLFIGTIESKAQVQTTAIPSPGLELNQNPFLDASTNYDLSIDPTSAGKGMVFPRTDLTTFTFRTELMDGINFPTALDGMIVYNVATGSTMATTPFGGFGQPLKADNGLIAAVAPGFYYFSNPIRLDEFLQPLTADTVEFGQWKPLGTGGSGVVTSPVKLYNNTTETSTGISIDGKQVYAITGTFTTLGVNALVSIPKPTGMTGYFKMTTYVTDINLVKRTFRNEISSFDINPTIVDTNNVVTGNGLFSEVYPAGSYTYTLEYFK
jgi:hypothetical protein